MGERRQTPEEIAIDASYTVPDGDTGGAALAALRALAAFGYRIVHESDPPMIEVTDFDEVEPRFVEGAPPKVRLDPEWSVAP